MKFLIIEVDDRGDLKSFNKLLTTTFPILQTLDAWEIGAVTPNNHSAKVINEMFEKINYDEDFDAININFITQFAKRAYKIAEEYKKRGKIVILSGSHPSTMPQEALKHADSVMVGRGEDVWPDVIRDLEKNDLKQIYKPKEPLNSNSLPALKINYPRSFVLFSHIKATRGCPFRCSFCQDSHIINGSNFRARPVEDVINEIKSHPQKIVIFYDFSLTIDIEYSKSLFRKMIGLNKKFLANGNIEKLNENEELLYLAKKAGCIAWFVGFESVSQSTINEIGKKTNIVDNYKEAVKKIHNHGMAVVGSFIFGFDSDTTDIFDNTLKMIEYCKIDVADFLILIPLPGTPLFKKLESENRILTKDWSKYSGRNVVFKPKNMTPEELYNGWERTVKEFYYPNRFVKRTFGGMKLGFYAFGEVFIRNLIARVVQTRNVENVELSKKERSL